MGSVVWITGASSGIGRALALEMAKRGHDLVVTAPTEAELHAVRTEIEALGRRCVVAPADVRDAAAMLAIPGECERQLGRPVDLAVANAGVLRYGTPSELTLADDTLAIEVNLMGTIHLVRAVLPAMLARRSGHVVAISSLAGILPMPLRPAYSASKAAVATYFRSLALDLTGTGVSTSVVFPGYVQSAMTTELASMPLAWTSERAAAYIADRLQRHRSSIAFPWPLVWGLTLLSLLPVALQNPILRRQRLLFRGR